MHYFTHLEQTPASIQIFAGVHSASGRAVGTCPAWSLPKTGRARACPPGVFPGARVFLASGLDNLGRAAISVDP
jgi:hypothetical protein